MTPLPGRLSEAHSIGTTWPVALITETKSASGLAVTVESPWPAVQPVAANNTKARTARFLTVDIMGTSMSGTVVSGRWSVVSEH